MSTYAEYLKQIADLEEQAAIVRKQEVAQAREQVRAIMSKYGLTLADIADAKQKAVPHGEVKYRDPVSGKTWSGHGRAPLWIAGEDRAKYLVN